MRGRSNFFLGAGLVIFLAAVALLYVFDPERHGFYPRCPLYVVTEWQCAGCGTLRAAHRVLHGDIQGAMAFNPILGVAVPLVLLLALKPALAYNRFVGWGVVVVVVLYSVWRNVGI